MLVVCLGTATEVGKTWIGSHVLARLRDDGIAVAARKPAQSFDPEDPGPSDSEVLAAATGQPASEVCPVHRSYRVAMAPPMAAEALGAPPPTLGDLLDEMVWPSPPSQLRWVESVGGVRSPLCSDADSVDLCDALRPDLVVLVADAGLGTINSVRLSCGALGDHEVVVVLNRFDPDNRLHQLNLRWLTDRDGFRAVSRPADLAAMVRERIRSRPKIDGPAGAA